MSRFLFCKISLGGFLACLLICSSAVQAQQALRVDAAELSRGVIQEIALSDLDAAHPYLLVADSAGNPLSLTSVKLDGRSLWTMESAEHIDRADAVNWHFDRLSGLLSIDFRNLAGQTSPASRLQVSISILQSHAQQFDLTFYRSTRWPPLDLSDSTGDAQVLNDLKVELK